MSKKNNKNNYIHKVDVGTAHTFFIGSHNRIKNVTNYCFISYIYDNNGMMSSNKSHSIMIQLLVQL